MHFECPHFIDSALMANLTAEASLQEHLNQFPGQRGPNHLTAERKDVHVIVFDSLVSGEHVVDEPSPHASNLVGADGCSHSTTAERYSAIHFSAGNGSGEWDYVVRIIVSWARMKGTEVNDLIGSITQQVRDLLLQNEPSMI
jgi:hypothetical protein